ncbi:hypothetical protein DL98DRAFT_542347 [Cadophora sp. DSE1049]|nr:hypothetical protein DL98DRAFT_542347 [Cadophora sp. DSE1049]
MAEPQLSQRETRLAKAQVERIGFTQLHAPAEKESIIADVVLVHGLGGHPKDTWKYRANEKTSHQDRRFWKIFQCGRNKGSTSAIEQQGSPGAECFWPEELLPRDFPNIRVLTYGYESNVSHFCNGAANQMTISQHGRTLLEGLTDERRDCGHRPIIFIAHSLGGLLVKDAIIESRKYSPETTERVAFQRCHAIMFFGTPHLGSGAAHWGVLLSNIVEALGVGFSTYKGVLRQLAPDSEKLESLTREFNDILNATLPVEKIKIYSFQEGKGISAIKAFDGKVVPDHSSWLNRRDVERNAFIPENHMNMCRFKHGNDAGYRLFKNGLQRYLDELPREDQERGSAAGQEEATTNAKDGLLDSSRQKGYWMVPFERNKYFVGRELLLQRLIDGVHPDMDKEYCQKTAIVGLGGVGKTQIALEVVYRIHKTDPECSIFWVPAVDSTSFEQAYRNIGRKLQIDGIEEDNADVKSLVKAALSHRAGRWLLVVDNADDLELLYGITAANDSVIGPSLARYLPFSEKGSILFTTRNEIAAKNLAGKNLISVGSMDPDEARKLLETKLDSRLMGDSETTTRLLDLLTNLPLAIMQASAYMYETEKTTTEYLEIYESDEDEMIYLLGRQFQDLDRYPSIKNAIATVWVISFRQVNALAAEYLWFMCFLAEQDIPRSLLPPGGEAETTDAIANLKAYGFITERERSGSYDIHRLVQVAARYWLKERGEWNVWASKTLRQLAQAFPLPKHENRDNWIRYIPHTQHVLKFREYADDGKAERDLLSNVAESFYILGKYEEAENMHRQALRLRETALGKEDPSTLMSMNNLANTLSDKGVYEEAEQMHRQTLELREKVLGKEHPDTLSSMNNVAIVLRREGKYEIAEQIHRQTLALRETLLPKGHPDTLSSMNNLALVLFNQGNDKGEYEEAEQMHRQALNLAEKMLGKMHPDTISSMNNLANILYNQGKYEEAEKRHRQTLELREKALGKEHPDTLTSMNNLALVLDNQGKSKEAVQMHRQTLELREKVLGKEHPSTLTSLNNLANALNGKGEYKKAERMHQQTLGLRKEVLGKEHPDTISSMNNLANVLANQVKYEEAEQMHRQALNLAEKMLGKMHPDTISSMNNLANILHNQGKYEEAEKRHRQTLELREKALGKEHPDTLTSMNNLALVLDNQGKSKEAVQMHRQTLELREKVLGKEHPSTLTSLNNLANALSDKGEYEEAEMHWQTLGLRKKVLGQHTGSALKFPASDPINIDDVVVRTRMAGVNVTSSISSTIAILKATKEDYNIVKDDSGLREAFHEAGRGLLLIEDAFQTAKTQLDGRNLAGDPQSITNLLETCNAKAKLSERIFNNVAQAPDTSRFKRYQAAVRQEGKGNTVEVLVTGMMNDVCGLAKDSAIEAAMKTQVKGLRYAIYKLSTMVPSVPNERLGNTFSRYGSGIQFNAHGGTQNNNTGSGSQFLGASTVHFGNRS